MLLTCDLCGRDFKRKRSKVRPYGKHYCGAVCRDLAKRVQFAPPEVEVEAETARASWVATSDGRHVSTETQKVVYEAIRLMERTAKWISAQSISLRIGRHKRTVDRALDVLEAHGLIHRAWIGTTARYEERADLEEYAWVFRL